MFQTDGIREEQVIGTSKSRLEKLPFEDEDDMGLALRTLYGLNQS
jgi:hypothetical protein